MKTTTKVIAAVLAVLMLSVVFAGAAAAVNEGANTVFVYKAYDPAEINGSWYLSNDHSKVITFVPCNDNKNVSLMGEDIVEGIYFRDTGSSNSIYVSYPYADISITYDNLSVINKKFSNFNTSKDGSHILNITANKVAGLNVSGLIFTRPDGVDTFVFNGYDFKNVNNTTISFDKVVNVPKGEWRVQAVFDLTNTELFPKDYWSSKIIVPSEGNYYYSKHVYKFTVGDQGYKIWADKDEVVKGNVFTIYIEGPISKDRVNGTPLSIDYPSDKKHLLVVAGQPSVVGAKETDVEAGTTVNYLINSTDSVAKIAFKTDSNTVSGKYKFTTGGKSVIVNLVKGKLTLEIKPESVYVGEEVTVYGTNTETDSVYLYIQGQNVPLQEIPLPNESRMSESVDGYLDGIPVKDDYTYKKSFVIANEFDVGTYTILATSEKLDLLNKKDDPKDIWGDSYVVDLGGKYKTATKKTATLELKAPFLTLTNIRDNIAVGDSVVVAGQVEGDPTKISYWLFGTNLFRHGFITPEDDGSFSKKISTTGFAAGQYFLIVQHPMYDKLFNVYVSNASSSGAYVVYSANTTDKGLLGPVVTTPSSINTRQQANAAESVCVLIDEEYVDDIYRKESFILAAAELTINAVSDVTKGSEFTISGKTNAGAGTQITVTVQSTQFTSKPKEDQSTSSYLVQTVKVVEGTSYNTWSATFSSDKLDIDTYKAWAYGNVGTDPMQTSAVQFDVVKAPVEPTTAPTEQPTTAPTEQPTPASPGFGALIALAGLGAVAVLVLRRK